MGERIVHWSTLRWSLYLFVAFLALSWFLWFRMPSEYPVHFNLAGQPTRAAEGPGMWVLLVAICAISFGQGYLFQRLVVTDPNSTLLNWPYRELFHRLPAERKAPVVLRGNRLLGIINIGMVLTFISILLMIFYSAHNPGSTAAALSKGVFWLVLGLILFVPLAEILMLRRMIRGKLEDEGLLAAPHSRSGAA